MPNSLRSPGPAKTFTSQSSYWSDEESIIQSLVVLLYGKFGEGKTTLAITISEFAPEELPTTKQSEITHRLEDCFVISFDKKGTAGLKERGIAVPVFNVHHFMTNKEAWQAAKYRQPPNILQAAAEGLKAAEAYGPKFLILDTVTSLDRGLVTYWLNHDDCKADTRKAYGRVQASHKELYDKSGFAPCLVVCCHSKYINPDEISDATDRSRAQDRLNTLTTADGGAIMPDITGKGQLPYKADNSLQLVVKSKRKGPKGIERWVTWCGNEEEGKNRFQLSLNEKEPPNLRKILNKIS